MKKSFKKSWAMLTAAVLLITLVLPITAFALKATSAKVMFTTTAGVDSVYLVVLEDGVQKDLEMKEQGGHWTVKDSGSNVEIKLLGVKIFFTGYSDPVFYESTELNTTPEGTGGSGTIIINLGAVVPPAQSNLIITKVWRVPTGTALPASITIDLKRDGANYKVITMTSDDAVAGTPLTWQTTTESVPVVNPTTGEDYVYTVTERQLNGYSTSVSGLTVINTITGIYDEIDVTKNWILPEGMAIPASVEIQLLANGVGTDETLTLTSTKLSDSFEDLSMYDMYGQLITYAVTENVPDDATYRLVGIEGSVLDGGFTVTNTVNQELVTIQGTKTWNVLEDFDSYPNITVRLFADDIEVASQVLENGATTYIFTQDDNDNPLPKYEFTTDEYGKVTAVSEIKYTVEEDEVAGFDTSVVGYDITNTLTDTTSITVTKEWVDVSGASHGTVGVVLTRNGDDYKTQQVSETYTWDELPVYDKYGAPYAYDVIESPVPEGYSMKKTGNAADGFVIINTLNQANTVSVSGTKTWRQPSNITAGEVLIGLYADGTLKTTQRTSHQTYAFTNLPKYKYVNVELSPEVPPELDPLTAEVIKPGHPAVYEEQAVEIVYTIKEGYLDEEDEFVPVNENHTLTVGDNTYKVTYNGYYVTNTIFGKTSISGTKTWEIPSGTDKQDVTIRLYIDEISEGDEIKSYKIEAGDSTYSFTNLDKYDAVGQLITYVVAEDSIAGFSSSKDGWNFKNTLNQAYTSVAVEKNWIDGNKPASEHPTITLYLYRSDNLEVPYMTYDMPNTETSHTFGFDGTNPTLPKYSDDRSVTYTYTVGEEPIGEGYMAPLVEGSTITNRIEQKDVTITTTKYWVDPFEIHNDVTFTLTGMVGDTTVVTDTKILDGDGDTNTVTWEGLDMYDSNGYAITYDIDELEIGGYTSVKSGTVPNFTFTNVINQEKVEVNGEKLWDIESSGQHNPQIPSSIWVQLYRDDTAYGDRLEVKASENWLYSFTGLDRYAIEVEDGEGYGDGHEYVYTVKEVYQDGGNWIAVQDSGKIIFGSDEFTVTYHEKLPIVTMLITDQVADKTVTIDIKNTYNEPSDYYCVIERVYNKYVSGEFVIDEHASTISVNESSVTIVPGSYTTFTMSGDPEREFTFTGATITGGGETQVLNFEDGERTIDLAPNTVYTITLNYRVDLYKLTVKYRLPDDSKAYPDEVSTYAPGESYSTVFKSAPTGYKKDTAPGNASGTFENQDITVIYTYSPRGGGHEDPEEPETPETPEIPEIIEIPEVEVPLVEIPEEEVPLAEPPYTGDEGKLVPFAIATLLSGVGLVLLGKKRKEDEAK